MISIIVPIYNVERYLDECIESIVSQTYTDLEIILVDDGSTDNCPSICDLWAEKDPRIKVLHKENGGLSDARNAGIAIASGDLIGFVDSDDYIRNDMYELLLDSLLSNDSDISACGVEIFWENNSDRKLLTPSGSCVLDKTDAIFEILTEGKIKQPVWYKLYKRDLLNDLPFPIGKFHEDAYWTYQVIGRANRISVVDTPCYFYRQRNASIMNSGYSIKRLDSLEAKLQCVDYMENNFPEFFDLTKEILCFSCLYAAQMSLKFLNGNEKKNAIKIIKQFYKKHTISFKQIAKQKGSKIVWGFLLKLSLMTTARLRNMLNIGF